MEPLLAAQLEQIPAALKALRRRAGHGSLRSAVDEIERRAGVRIDPSRLSRWERGISMPSTGSLLTFLTGLGLTFTHLHRELGAAVRHAPAPPGQSAEPGAPFAEIPADADPQTLVSLHERLQDLEERVEALELEAG